MPDHARCISVRVQLAEDLKAVAVRGCGHHHEGLVFVGGAQYLPVERVLSGRRVDEGLGAVRLVARVALGPPGTEVRVAQREFPDQFRQARLALAVGRRTDVSDTYPGDGGPV